MGSESGTVLAGRWTVGRVPGTAEFFVEGSSVTVGNCGYRLGGGKALNGLICVWRAAV